MNIPHCIMSKNLRRKLQYKRAVGQMLTKADEGGSVKYWPFLTRGGGGQKNFNKRSLRVLKMWVERTIDLNLTIYVKQSHITCKLDPNKWISPILSCQKVYVENCSTKGPSGKCWRKLTRGGGGVSQMLTIADEGGRGGQPKADHCWRGGGVYEPPILADVICEQPLMQCNVSMNSRYFGRKSGNVWQGYLIKAQHMFEYMWPLISSFLRLETQVDWAVF